MKKNIFRILTAVLMVAVVLSAFAACTQKETGNEKDTENFYAIRYNGTEIALDADAKSVVKKIGEPSAKQNTGNCGDHGETVRYDYSGFEMVVVEYKSGAKVDEIEILNDLVETSKGITIGSSESAVKAAYGEPSRTDGKALFYEKGNKLLTIGIEDGYVSTLNLKVIGVG